MQPPLLKLLFRIFEKIYVCFFLNLIKIFFNWFEQSTIELSLMKLRLLSNCWIPLHAAEILFMNLYNIQACSIVLPEKKMTLSNGLHWYPFMPPIQNERHLLMRKKRFLFRSKFALNRGAFAATISEITFFNFQKTSFQFLSGTNRKKCCQCFSE